MCGICGIIGGEQRLLEPAVRRMMRAMIHRGPDDEGYEELNGGDSDGGPAIGFGFRRLSILDLSLAGHQPMFNGRTGDCLIFNGEIYNFRELQADLQSRGVSFHGKSDSEVLLHALSVWGEQAVEKLHGMYAFAFYQAKTRRVLLGRDPLGIKPLYVSRLSDSTVFASEIRAVRASGLVPNGLDIAGLASMMAYGAVQSPLTVHENVRSFPAGSIEWLDPRHRWQESPRRFWAFPSIANHDYDAAECAGNVEQLVRQATLSHLVADVPVGVFLSGGIDSTIIASFAREYTPKVTAFTVGLSSDDADPESEVAAATAARLGIRHVSVRVDSASLPAAWHDWLLASDSPSIDGFNTYLVSRQLAGEGVVVGLSGLGADELFGGYSVFWRAGRLSRLLRAMPFLSTEAWRSGLSALASLDGRSAAYEKLADLAAGDRSIAGITKSLRRTLSNHRMAELGLAPSRVGLGADYLPEMNGSCFLPECEDVFNAVSRTEMVHYMSDTLLRDTDVNSMAHSLEVRVPMLDRPLVEYVSGLPGSVKQSLFGKTKALLRKAARDVLPNAVVNRPKVGFTLPIGEWMRGDMRDACDAAIGQLARSAAVNGAEVRRIWSTFLASPRAMHWSRPLSLVVAGNAIG